jgi:hypothetical protein
VGLAVVRAAWPEAEVRTLSRQILLQACARATIYSNITGAATVVKKIISESDWPARSVNGMGPFTTKTPRHRERARAQKNDSLLLDSLDGAGAVRLAFFLHFVKLLHLEPVIADSAPVVGR